MSSRARRGTAELRRTLAAVVPLATIPLVAAVLTAQARAWQVSGGEVAVHCPLTVGGSFEAKTGSIAGELRTDPSRPSALTGELSVDLRTLDTGIGLRNTHLRENYLEVNRGDGFDRAVLSDIALERGDAATFEGETRFNGTLLLHGVRKAVSGEARLRRNGAETRVEAEFPVRLPEFGVPEPRYLGVGVRDVVQVRVSFRAAGMAPETAGS